MTIERHLLYFAFRAHTCYVNAHVFAHIKGKDIFLVNLLFTEYNGT